MADPLMRVPGLGGYLASQQARQAQQNQEIQQVGALQALLMNQAKMRQATAAADQESRYRAAIGSLPNDATPEQMLTVARPFMGAKDLATMITASQDRAAARETTKQIALQRLGQQIATETRHAYEFAQTLDLQQRRAALAEINARAQAAYKAGSLAIAAGNLNYNTGADTSGIMDVVSQLRQQSQPPQQPLGQSLPPLVPPQDAAAYMSARAGVPALADRQVSQQELDRMVEIPPVQQPQAPVQVAPPSPAPAPRDNLDARDLMLRNVPNGGRSRAPQVPAPQPPPSNALPQMPPEIARAPRKIQDQWRVRQTSNAGGGVLAPDTLRFVAQQYLAGDRQAISGFARNATARIAIQNAIVDEAQRRGMSPEQTAAQIADFAGTMSASRTVGQRAANISLAASEAEEMLGIVKQTSDSFARSNFIPWNVALKYYETGTGTPEVAAFGAAVNALVNVYARAINPTGQPTVSDKEHARAVLNTVQSPAQVDAVMSIIRKELEIAKKAPGTVSNALRSKVTGGGATVSNW